MNQITKQATIDAAVAGKAFTSTPASEEFIKNLAAKLDQAEVLRRGRAEKVAKEKAAYKELKALRKARRDVVQGEADARYIQFLHVRKFWEVRSVISEHYNGFDKRIEMVEVDDVEATHGGWTIAYHPIIIEGQVWARCAVAFCCDEDKFDSLIGMEEAMKKFADGNTIDIHVGNDSLDEQLAIDFYRQSYHSK